MKVSLIATVFNESKTIDVFVNALLAQTRKADEIIVIDGGSTDSTVSKLKGYSNIKVSVAKGNRSVGRNQAISLATGNVIAITDAGCVADPTWLEELLKPFNQKSTDVVAGYYQSKAQTIYQKCLTPYALVMPDKVDSQTFLPATRSMAIKKSVWEAVGGFNEKFSHNEDYVFAREIKKLGTHIVFAKDAVVYWIPRNSIKESYTMFYRFSFGDIEAGILRPKVIVLFARYIVGILLLLTAFLTNSLLLGTILVVVVIFYLLWSIQKNYRYIQDLRAVYYLPLIQITADIAVLHGSLKGMIKKYGL